MKRKIVLISAVGLLAVACTDSSKPNVELIQDMMDQKAIKAQDYDPFTGKQGMRLPPEGTVPAGFQPYKYAQDPIAAEANLKNPLAGDMSPQTLRLGQKNFEIYCAVCHGVQGKGDGTVAEKMSLKPPTLLSDKVRQFQDGRIFHIITAGQGVMGSYANQIINERDRWAVVNYVRNLQKLAQ